MEQDIIIIDDDDILLIILEKMFKKVNPELRISTFRNGEGALNYLINNEFKVVPYLIVDIFLSDISGWQILERLDEDGRFEAKVVMMTSSTESENFTNSTRYKCVSSFFEKPITYDKVKFIDQLISDQRPPYSNHDSN